MYDSQNIICLGECWSRRLHAFYSHSCEKNMTSFDLMHQEYRFRVGE